MAAPTGWYDITDYGAVGDGTGDQTIHINAAISAITSYGGVLYIPPGLYQVGGGGTPIDPIPDYVTVQGAGAGASMLLCTANQGILSIDGAKSVAIADIGLQYEGGPPQDQQTGLTVIAVKQLSLRNVNVTGANIGIQFQSNATGSEGCGEVWCNNVMVTVPSGATGGICVLGGGESNAAPNVNLRFTDCVVSGEGSGYGWFLAGIQGSWLTACEGNGCGTGLALTPGADSETYEFEIANCAFDSNIEHGCNIGQTSDDSGYVYDERFIACRFSNTVSGSGITINNQLKTAATCNTMVLAGCDVFGNAEHGVYLEACSEVQISCCSIYGNNATGGKDVGVRVQKSHHVLIAGCSLLGNLPNQSPSQYAGADINGALDTAVVGCNLGNSKHEGLVGYAGAHAQSCLTVNNLGQNPMGKIDGPPALTPGTPIQNPYSVPATVYIAGDYSAVAIGSASDTLTTIATVPPAGSGIRLNPKHWIEVTLPTDPTTEPTWQWFLD